jgi:hypothetical protein
MGAVHTSETSVSFQTKYFLHIYSLYHVCYMTCQSCPTWFDYCILWRVRSTELLASIVSFPASYLQVFTAAPCPQTPSVCTSEGPSFAPIQNKGSSKYFSLDLLRERKEDKWSLNCRVASIRRIKSMYFNITVILYFQNVWTLPHFQTFVSYLFLT